MAGIRSGDHMVLYAVGSGKRIFALARVTSEVHEGDDPAWPFRVSISYLVNRPVSSGVTIDQICTRNLVGAIQHGASYIELTAEEYNRAGALLGTAAGSTVGEPSQPVQM
jgi:hypothetical protein